jgi:hypothetical protein
MIETRDDYNAHVPIIYEMIPFSKGIMIKIKNLQNLTVSQIQSLEFFTQKRRGIFDFSTHTIILHKKIEHSHLQQLFEFEHIDVQAEEIDTYHDKEEKHQGTTENDINKKYHDNSRTAEKKSSNVKISFGKYKGKFYSEIPDSYLLWLKKNYKGLEESNIVNETIRRKI